MARRDQDHPGPVEAAELEHLEERPAPLEIIEGLLDADDLPGAITLAHDLHGAELGHVLVSLEREERDQILAALDAGEIAAALSYVEPHFRGELLHVLDVNQLSDVLAVVPDDVAADVVQELSDDIDVADLMEALPNDRQAQIEELLEHQANTAGGRMTGQIVALLPDASVGEALDAIRAIRPDARQPFYIYVTDDHGQLLGVMPLRSMLVAAPDTLVRDVMLPSVASVHVATDQEEAARLLKQYNLLALPVVDDDGRLVGTITHDDVTDVLEDEATEDMFRMVGVDAEEDLRNVRRSIRYRLPWLTVNLFTALSAGFVVSRFEATIASLAVLAAFMPVVAGQGGNAGIQTVTVVVRSIALGRVQRGDMMRVLWHELRSGLVFGLVNGFAIGLIVYMWQGSAWLSLVVGLALMLNVQVGVLVGALIPMGLHRLRQDPALSSGIWLTMSTDLLGFFFFLGLATLLISQLT